MQRQHESWDSNDELFKIHSEEFHKELPTGVEKIKSQRESSRPEQASSQKSFRLPLKHGSQKRLNRYPEQYI